LISVELAIASINQEVKGTSHHEIIPLEKSLDRVIAQNIHTPIAMPPFRQSSMDGYAVYVHNLITYEIIGEIKAGDNHTFELKKGQAVRIFTGAPVPDTANAIVIQEHTHKKDSTLYCENTIAIGDYIRPIGEQIELNNLALSPNTTITSSTIGFLAGLGITTVPVYKKPSVSLIITGNELAQPGEKLNKGQVYDSNSIMLKSALTQLGIDIVTIHHVPDNYEDTRHLIASTIKQSDFTIISGGISVGDYDFVYTALQEINVKELFYKVKQKPGKPLYFGKKEGHFIFALPGNPASALSCFYIYVRNAIFLFENRNTRHLNGTLKKATNSFIKKGNRAQFLKAYTEGNIVEILDSQASSMLNSFAVANALVYLPEEKQQITPEEMITVIPIS